MAAHDYHFITRWRFEAKVEEVIAVLKKAEDLPRWWPSVYLDVTVIDPGGTDGVGKTIDLYTKGWLPYTLRWRFTVVDSNEPHGWTIEAKGDFVGRGIWTFEQDGAFTNVTYDWRIRAEKPLLRWLSALMKPIFAKNHEWAMARGEESLRLELQRRRAESPDARAKIAAPPPATPTSLVPFLLGQVPR